MSAHQTRRAPQIVPRVPRVRTRVKVVLSVATLAIIGVLAGTASSLRPAEPSAKVTTASHATVPTAVSPPSYPQVPRWAAVDEADTSLARELEQAKERVVKSLTLPNGLEAKIYPTRPRYPAGSAIELRLELRDKRGQPVSGRGGLDAFLLENDAPSSKFGFFADATVPGLYHGFVTPKSPKGTKAMVTVSVSETGLAMEPGAVVSVALPIGASGGASIVTGPRGVIVDDRVTVTVGVEAAVAGPVALRAELIDASGAAVGQATGHASLGAGRGEVVLTFDHVPVTGAEVTTLRLANMTLFAGQPLTWSDFTTDAMRVRSLSDGDEVARGIVH